MRNNVIGLALLWSAVIMAVTPAMAGPFDRFNGRWAGWGRITLDNGNSQNMKCVSVYRIGKGGASASQSFRCTSDGYRFDAKANYKASGRTVSGTWTEAIYAMQGTIAAKLTASGFQGSIRSNTFAGRIKVSHSGHCRQTLVVSPRQIEVRSLTVDLKRC